MSSLVLRKVLVVFIKRLTPDGMYPVQDCENLQIPIQMRLSQKNFLNFLFNFWNLLQIFKILSKRIIFIANVFLKVLTLKILLRPLSKTRRFRTHFDSQHVKASHILAKSR